MEEKTRDDTAAADGHVSATPRPRDDDQLEDRNLPALRALYERSERDGVWLQEWRLETGYLAAAGLITELQQLAELRRATGKLAPHERFDPNQHLDLGEIIFALTSAPGTGPTRVTACEDALHNLNQLLRRAAKTTADEQGRSSRAPRRRETR